MQRFLLLSIIIVFSSVNSFAQYHNNEISFYSYSNPLIAESELVDYYIDDGDFLRALNSSNISNYSASGGVRYWGTVEACYLGTTVIGSLTGAMIGYAIDTESKDYVAIGALALGIPSMIWSSVTCVE